MNTIQLRQNNNLKVQYYLTSITQVQADKLIEVQQIKNVRERNAEFNKLSIQWKIDCINIIKIGETATIRTTELTGYIGSFEGKDTGGTNGQGKLGDNRELHYRNYLKTEAQQKDLAWLIIECSERSTSVKTALKQMREAWTILWETPINSPFDNKMTKNLKDKVCYTENY